MPERYWLERFEFLAGHSCNSIRLKALSSINSTTRQGRLCQGLTRDSQSNGSPRTRHTRPAVPLWHQLILFVARNYSVLGVRVGAEPEMFSSDNLFLAIAIR